MKNTALSATAIIVVAFALVAVFVYGVEFGRKITLDAMANARYEPYAASYYSYDTYSPGPGQDEYEYSGTYDYTPSEK